MSKDAKGTFKIDTSAVTDALKKVAVDRICKSEIKVGYSRIEFDERTFEIFDGGHCYFRVHCVRSSVMDEATSTYPLLLNFSRASILSINELKVFNTWALETAGQ